MRKIIAIIAAMLILGISSNLYSGTRVCKTFTDQSKNNGWCIENIWGVVMCSQRALREEQGYDECGDVIEVELNNSLNAIDP